MPLVIVGQLELAHSLRLQAESPLDVPTTVVTTQIKPG